MNILDFNDTLTNNIVSFEQPGPGHCKTALALMYQEMPSEGISEEDWLILTLTLITTFQLVK